MKNLTIFIIIVYVFAGCGLNQESNQDDLRQISNYEQNIIVKTDQGKLISISIWPYGKITEDQNAESVAISKYQHLQNICQEIQCVKEPTFKELIINENQIFAVSDYQPSYEGYFLPYNYLYYQKDGYIKIIHYSGGEPEENHDSIIELLSGA
ncbi:hypothetical protein GF376_02395 [Candidatus Peregrinibacteria bacterium]|nr:hypothetical protein [Candidatus Peregrinibacteria bacterium]